MNPSINLNDFAALSPLLILLGGALVLLLIESFGSEAVKKLASYATLAVLASAL